MLVFSISYGARAVGGDGMHTNQPVGTMLVSSGTRAGPAGAMLACPTSCATGLRLPGPRVRLPDSRPQRRRRSDGACKQPLKHGLHRCCAMPRILHPTERPCAPAA